MGWSPTGRSTARLALPCKGNGTSWACGWGPAVRERSTGNRSSPGMKNRGTSVRVHRGVRRPDGPDGGDHARPGRWPSTKRASSTCCAKSFRYAARKDWPAIAADLRPVYLASTEAAARARLDEFTDKWNSKYPAIVKLWESAWAEFVPFLQFDPEIRAVIYSTNAIESIHARFRRAVRARGHFPTENAALKCVYLTVRSLDPTGKGRQRWMNRWKQPLNAFAVTFEGRILNPSN